MKSLLFALAIAWPGFASAHQGSITFTAEEQADHAAHVDEVLETAAACIVHDLRHHQDFYRQHGFSPYYGDRSRFGKLSYADKKAYLKQMRVDVRLLDQMEPTSCVGLTLKCLGQGFRAAGEQAYWDRIRAYTMLNDADGTALQAALQKLGWKILYWNPDVRMNQTWDEEEKAKNPTNSDRFWGYHEENWLNVSRHGRYLYNTVDDDRTLVNFGPRFPAYLASIPFFVGTAHMGYHVFPGTFGQVIEAHSTRRITDPKTVQSAPFNPLGGGAPTDGEYFSGLIAVPGKYAPSGGLY